MISSRSTGVGYLKHPGQLACARVALAFVRDLFQWMAVLEPCRMWGRALALQMSIRRTSLPGGGTPVACGPYWIVDPGNETIGSTGWKAGG
jgi:hypothetical protein